MDVVAAFFGSFGARKKTAYSLPEQYVPTYAQTAGFLSCCIPSALPDTMASQKVEVP